MVVFNLEVTHAASFALKTTTAFNEEPKKENLAWLTEEGESIAKNSRFLSTNGVIFAYICSQSTKSDICVWEIIRRREWKPTEHIGYRMRLQPHHSFDIK